MIRGLWNLDRFRDVLVGALVADVDQDLCRRILRVIAAIGPVRVEDNRLADRIASFVGEPAIEVRRTVLALETAGVLSRRGSRLRVVPDVLSDFILEDASFVGGRAVGYCAEIVAA